MMRGIASWTDGFDEDSGQRERIACFLLALLVLLVYGLSLWNGYVWDDEYILVKNTSIRSLDHLSRILLQPDLISQKEPTPYYRPLARASFLLDGILFGLRPALSHALNLILHGLNVLLVFRLGRRLLKDGLAAFLAALLFAVHPINSEAVNLVSARNTLLATAFFLGAVLLHLRGQESGWRSSNWWAAALFFLGLCSKEIAALALPLLLLLPLDQVPRSWEGWRARFLALLPMGLAVCLYLPLRTWVLWNSQPLIPAQGLWARLGSLAVQVPEYLRLLVFPRTLKAYYSNPAAHGEWFVVFTAWVLFTLAVIVLVRRGGIPIWTGLIWLAVNFLPPGLIALAPGGFMAERYVYLDAVGAFFIIGSLLAPLLGSASPRRTILLSILFALTALLSARTAVRCLDWRDNITLFTSLAKEDPSSALAHGNLGDTFRKNGEFQKAKIEWEKALELDPRMSEALVFLGNMALLENRVEPAKGYFVRAIQAEPKNAAAHYNLAQIQASLGEYPEALASYRAFVELAEPELQEAIRTAEERIRELEARTGRSVGSGFGMPPSH